MWNAGVSTFALFLGLQALAVQADLTCHVDHTLTSRSTLDTSKLREDFAEPVASLCASDLQPNGQQLVSQVIGDTTLSILRKQVAQGFEECSSAFDALLSQCLEAQSLSGGDYQDADGIVYTVHHSAAGHDEKQSNIEARAKKPKRPSKPAAPKPAPKPNPKPVSPPKQPAKPKSSNVPKPSSSKTSSAAAPGPTKSCKQMYALELAKSVKLAQAENRADAVVARDGFVGSRVSVEKRKTNKKPGNACGAAFDALPYPDKDAVPSSTKYYAMTQPESCDVFGLSESSNPPNKDKPNAYQVEHILEWQLVAHFFDWMNEKKHSRAKTFDNPEPGKKDKVDFCNYWKSTWQGANPAKFSIDQSEPRTPIQHMRFAYPGDKNFPQEFALLETVINSPGKTQMWAIEKAKKDKTRNPKTGLYDETKMLNLIKGKEKGRKPNKFREPKDIDQAKEALSNLKHALGARKYMRSPKIAALFKKQRDRIGAMLGRLDTELARHPKTSTKGQPFAAWTPQGLEKAWKEYMAERFALAQTRLENDMTKYLAALNAEWGKVKNKPAPGDTNLVQFQTLIAKLEAEWNKEKNTKWTNPA